MCVQNELRGGDAVLTFSLWEKVVGEADRMRGYDLSELTMAVTPHPACFASHPLPMGEGNAHKRYAAGSRKPVTLRRLSSHLMALATSCAVTASMRSGHCSTSARPSPVASDEPYQRPSVA